MNWRDCRKGAEVYHGVFVHWGKGEVVDVVDSHMLENMFEKGGRRRLLVRFEGKDNLIRLLPREVRKTPNKKKIRDMVALYHKRGMKAVDAGDRLIVAE